MQRVGEHCMDGARNSSKNGSGGAAGVVSGRGHVVARRRSGAICMTLNVQLRNVSARSQSDCAGACRQEWIGHVAHAQRARLCLLHVKSGLAAFPPMRLVRLSGVPNGACEAAGSNHCVY